MRPEKGKRAQRIKSVTRAMPTAVQMVRIWFIHVTIFSFPISRPCLQSYLHRSGNIEFMQGKNQAIHCFHFLGRVINLIRIAMHSRTYCRPPLGREILLISDIPVSLVKPGGVTKFSRPVSTIMLRRSFWTRNDQMGNQMRWPYFFS
jgi:hypothetical protein